MPIIVYRDVQQEKYSHCKGNRRLENEQRKPAKNKRFSTADILLTCQRRTGSLQEDGSASVFSAYPLTLEQTTDSAFPSFPIPSDRSRGSADCLTYNNPIYKGGLYKGGIYPKRGTDKREAYPWMGLENKEKKKKKEEQLRRKDREQDGIASAIRTAKDKGCFFLF